MAFELDKFLVGFAIFALFLTSFLFVIGQTNQDYSTSISTNSFNKTYSSIDDLYNLSQNQKDKVIGGEVDADAFEDGAIGESLKAVRTISTTFGILGDVINDLSSEFGVPTFIIKFLLTIFTILIIFAIIYLFVRFRP